MRKAISKNIRLVIHNKFNGRCAYCGVEIELKQMQVDHVIPHREFHTHIKNNYKIPEFLSHLEEHECDHEDNLFPACRVCNLWKSAMDLEYFRSELERQIKRINETSSNYRIAKKYGLVTENPKPIKFYFELNI